MPPSAKEGDYGIEAGSPAIGRLVGIPVCSAERPRRTKTVERPGIISAERPRAAARDRPRWLPECQPAGTSPSFHTHASICKTRSRGPHGAKALATVNGWLAPMPQGRREGIRPAIVGVSFHAIRLPRSFGPDLHSATPARSFDARSRVRPSPPDRHRAASNSSTSASVCARATISSAAFAARACCTTWPASKACGIVTNSRRAAGRLATASTSGSAALPTTTSAPSRRAAAMAVSTSSNTTSDRPAVREAAAEERANSSVADITS